jgi:hypothetical protein
MIVCNRCGKENQDHYKFCLGCGAELSAPGKGGGDMAMMKTMMADTSGIPAPPAPRPGGLPGVGPGPGGLPGMPGMPPPGFGQAPGPMGPPPGMGPGPGPLGPPPPGPGPMGPPPGMGGPGPGHMAPPPGFGAGPLGPPPPGPMGPPPGLGGPLPPPGPLGGMGGMGPGSTGPGFGPPPGASGLPPLNPGPGPMGPPPGMGGGGPPPAGPPPGVPPGVPLGGFGAPPPSAPVATGPRGCPQCGSAVPPGFRFCGSCGFRMDEVSQPAIMPVGPSASQAAPAARPQPRALLTLIRPDGSEGGTHELRQGENKIGRQFGAVFETDGYLSPVHAEITVNGATATVRDLDSLNGVFVKMTEAEEIRPTQILRLGQELLRFDVIQAPEAVADGTEVMGSPNPGYWGKLTVIIGRDITGAAFPLLGESCTLGRERGEINFPDDGYVSGLHARVNLRDGRVYLQDLGSSNGTFIKVNGERAIGHESFVLLGQQLFRLNLA